jgi:D-glycero-D-manno-heptose 1,7-bisphosphate phosphatase
VLNQARVVDGLPLPPRDVSELSVIATASEACASLRAAGYRLVVVTNQPDIARGTETIDGVNALHDAILENVSIDEFVVCPHDDADDCLCRKPRPGMILAAADRLRLDLARSCMSVTGGATSKPASGPGAPRSSSTAATRSRDPSLPTLLWPS